MSSILKVDTIQDQAGNNIINESGNVITIGASGDTITVPAGATVSGFTSAGIDDNATSVAITIDSSERVGIGTTSPLQLLHLKSTTNEKPNLLIETENAGANGGRLDFLHKSSSPADGDLLGDITFGGYSDSGTPPSDFARYVMMKAFAEDVSNNAEKGRLTFSIHSGASNENNVDVLTLNGTKVGIGTTSPATNLEIRTTASDNGILLKSTGNTGSALDFDANRTGALNGIGTLRANWNGNGVAAIYLNAGSDTTNKDDGIITFNTRSSGTGVNPPERMRIDSSGNTMFAKSTQGDVNVVGAEIRNNGLGTFTRDGDTVLIANRKSSSGTILEFRKDNTAQGVIGSTGNFYIADNSGYGFNFDDGGAVIYSCNSSGTLQNNVVNLGHSSYRWKDIYLGGGAFLGGTGDANKLDDYEEGTWTPNLDGISSSNASGQYTKIGNVCTAKFKISSDGSGSNVSITGFPFTSQAGFEQQGLSRETQTSGKLFFIRMPANATAATIIRYDASSSITSNDTFEGNITYITNT